MDMYVNKYILICVYRKILCTYKMYNVSIHINVCQYVIRYLNILLLFMSIVHHVAS